MEQLVELTRAPVDESLQCDGMILAIERPQADLLACLDATHAVNREKPAMELPAALLRLSGRRVRLALPRA